MGDQLWHFHNYIAGSCSNQTSASTWEKAEKVFQYQNWFRLNREKKICIAYYKNSILGLGKLWILYIVKSQTFHLWIAEITTNPHWSIIWTKINFNTQHKVTNKDKRWLDSSLTDNFLTVTKEQISFYNHFEGKKQTDF